MTSTISVENQIDRLYKTYDKIEEMEASLVSAKAKRRSILAEKVSGDNIYKALIYFDKLYDPMDEAERREFLSQLIEAVEIYAERKPNGQWLKSIEFKLPIIPHDMEISLDNGSHVETVVLMSKVNTVKSDLPLKKFFNTSGLLYKEMQLKDKLPTMSEEEQLQLLATNGMLVKRPLVVNDDTVLVGFKETEWSEKLKWYPRYLSSLGE